LETVFDELGPDGFERAIAPLRDEVKRRSSSAAKRSRAAARRAGTCSRGTPPGGAEAVTSND
jgi:hypothetical protein